MCVVKYTEHNFLPYLQSLKCKIKLWEPHGRKGASHPLPLGREAVMAGRGHWIRPGVLRFLPLPAAAFPRSQEVQVTTAVGSSSRQKVLTVHR